MKKTLRFCGWLVMLWVVSFMLQPMPFAQADDDPKLKGDKKVETVVPAEEDDDDTVVPTGTDEIDVQDQSDDKESEEPEEDDDEEDD